MVNCHEFVTLMANVKWLVGDWPSIQLFNWWHTWK